VLITDGAVDGNLSFERRDVVVKRGEKLELTIKPNGGFVLVFE
jgi:hypothetical protein